MTVTVQRGTIEGMTNPRTPHRTCQVPDCAQCATKAASGNYPAMESVLAKIAEMEAIRDRNRQPGIDQGATVLLDSDGEPEFLFVGICICTHETRSHPRADQRCTVADCTCNAGWMGVDEVPDLLARCLTCGRWFSLGNGDVCRHA